MGLRLEVLTDDLDLASVYFCYRLGDLGSLADHSNRSGMGGLVTGLIEAQQAGGIRADLPPLARAIHDALKRVGFEHFYAVHSSATAEDLAFASFAGQQDTYLNVKGEQVLLEAVCDCWASLFADLLYRAQNRIEHQKVYMSVVQRVRRPQVSGIMFTASIVDGQSGILGEATMASFLTPGDERRKRHDGQEVAAWNRRPVLGQGVHKRPP